MNTEDRQDEGMRGGGGGHEVKTDEEKRKYTLPSSVVKEEEDEEEKEEEEEEEEKNMKENDVTEEESFQEAFKSVGFAKLSPPPPYAQNERSAISQDYYIQKYEVVLGRVSKTSNVDVVLGTEKAALTLVPSLLLSHANTEHHRDIRRRE